MKDGLFTSLTANEEANLSGGKGKKIVISGAINSSATNGGDVNIVGGPDSTNTTDNGKSTITTTNTNSNTTGVSFNF
jgi:hypothetical protein